ncbi:MAG: nucleoside triphosphate pyrophosphohydrolase family protein [Terriglobia bacterium]
MTQAEYEAWFVAWRLRGKHFNEPSIPVLAFFALGLAGEAGEVVDVIKKSFRDAARCGGWKSGLDREKLVLELGDVEWYLQAIRDAVGIDRSEVLFRNVCKLEKRAAPEQG